jgi:hypothetical protein
MAEFQTAHRHEHPALDVARLEDEASVLDDGFQVRVKKLEDQVEVGFRREDIEQLQVRQVTQYRGTECRPR